MSRAQRLLDVIQLLRSHRRPVAACRLADELGVSLRTIYRDIETLKSQGAHIDGEAGIGYVLRPGFMLPPLMFSEEEIEALVLGGRWVAAQPDEPLGKAARNALAKIAAVLPDDLQRSLETSSLMVARRDPAAGDLNCRSSGPPSAPNANCALPTATNETTAPNARSGRSHSDSSIGYAWWRPGARAAATTAISALTGSCRSRSERRYPRRRTDLLREWQQRERIGER